MVAKEVLGMASVQLASAWSANALALELIPQVGRDSVLAKCACEMKTSVATRFCTTKVAPQHTTLKAKLAV